MSNNILEPIPSNLNDYLLKYRVITLSNTTPAALPSKTNVTFQMDGFGNISACVAGGGTSLSLQTNGVANGSQTLLNLAAGTNVTATDNGSGTITLAAPNAASAGAANKIQKVGGTAGSFAASSLTDDGTTVSTTEAFTATGAITTTNGNLIGQQLFAANGNVIAGFSASVSGEFRYCLNPDQTDAGATGISAATANGDYNLRLDAKAGFGHQWRVGGSVIASMTSTLLTAPALALSAATSTTTATAGAATALPATPQGYITVSINGTARKVPYYAV